LKPLDQVMDVKYLKMQLDITREIDFMDFFREPNNKG